MCFSRNYLDQKGCPACSHSLSTSASKPLTVLQSGSRITCAREVTHRVTSTPSDP